MPEEKYISIEYSLWEGKYKGLEEENKRLNEKLKEWELSGQLIIHFHSNYVHLRNGCRIGYIEFTPYGVFKVNIQIDKEIKQAILREMDQNDMYEPSLKKEEAYALAKQINQSINDYEAAYKRLMEAKNNLPRFVRWLFKINR